MTSLLLALLLQSGSAPTLPEALARYLDAHPPYHLLGVLELAREREYILGHHVFAPFAVADVAGDGVDDVVAVLVRKDGSRNLYGVAALQGGKGSDPPSLLWIVKEGPDPILGVTSGEKGRIDVWKCYQCPSNPFFRWNGAEYQANLRGPGESIHVYHGATASVAVRQDASPSARVVASLPPCSEAHILSLAPHGGHVRFYEISAYLGDKKVQGFVAAEEVDEMPCMGR